MKTCGTCKEEKRLNEYHGNGVRNGVKCFQSACKKCKSKSGKEYYLNNKEYKKKKDKDYNKKMGKENPELFLWRRCRQRAKFMGIDFNLELSDIVIPEVCPILGMKISFSTGKGQQPNSISIDKIDPSLGYVKGNVVVISWRANSIKHDATIEELNLIANYYNGLILLFLIFFVI